MIDLPLVGIETEYGLTVEGCGPADQVEESARVVQSYAGVAFSGWDYGDESPRSDLRGFRVDRLQVDPEDWKFEAASRVRSTGAEIRHDRVLWTGARFYNDHGHPEYSTPECRSAEEVARHDLLGEQIVREAAAAYSAETGREVRVYKNNTDFHGASYGTHESYLCSRSLGFDGLAAAVIPMLVVRQVLTGAGKVGSESGAACPFQISQRADFLTETANVETLYRRPIFNTRDEPHADPARFIRLHVISGDANRMPACTRRKVQLVQLAVSLAEQGSAPKIRLKNAVQAFQAVSRACSVETLIATESGSMTAGDILEAYLEAGQEIVPGLAAECHQLLAWLQNDDPQAARHIDWVAKRAMIEEFGADADLPTLQSLDLAYADLDLEASLYPALMDMGRVAEPMAAATDPPSDTRALVRALAVSRFADALEAVSWNKIRLRTARGAREFRLDPTVAVPAELVAARDVEMFVSILENAYA